MMRIDELQAKLARWKELLKFAADDKLVMAKLTAAINGRQGEEDKAAFTAELGHVMSQLKPPARQRLALVVEFFDVMLQGNATCEQWLKVIHEAKGR